jgi:hypothetical protein
MAGAGKFFRIVASAAFSGSFQEALMPNQKQIVAIYFGIMAFLVFAAWLTRGASAYSLYSTVTAPFQALTGLALALSMRRLPAGKGVVKWLIGLSATWLAATVINVFPLGAARVVDGTLTDHRGIVGRSRDRHVYTVSSPEGTWTGEPAASGNLKVGGPVRVTLTPHLFGAQMVEIAPAGK